VADGDVYDSQNYTDVPIVDATATYDKPNRRAVLFVANRSLTESSSLDVDLRGIGASTVHSATTLHAGERNRNTTNGTTHDAVTPRPFDDYMLDAGQLKANLPPLSWTVLEFNARRA
jgi:alpha-L-arabinofuranosidase